MRSRFRLEPSVGIATLALFVALGGTSQTITGTITAGQVSGAVANATNATTAATATSVNGSTLEQINASAASGDGLV
jgi:hypothetical protein